MCIKSKTYCDYAVAKFGLMSRCERGAAGTESSNLAKIKHNRLRYVIPPKARPQDTTREGAVQMTDSTSPAGSPTIAIVGSGPAGCYLAQFLHKQWNDAEIVIFDRVTLPYGLVRYGVAPDHLGTKAIAKQFDRLLDKPGITFVGDTHVGVDVSLDDLRAAFDIVVLATGLSADRRVENHRPDLAGVIGAGTFTRLINGHPDETAETLELGTNVTIVGHGNVAIDVARLLLTPGAALTALGVGADVTAALQRTPITRINIVGRSLAPAAKFDLTMLKELGALPDTRIIVEAPQGPAPHDPASGRTVTDVVDDRRTEMLNDMIASSPASATRTLAFYFGWMPIAYEGASAVTGVTFRAAGKADYTLATDSVITAVGFVEHDDAAIRLEHHTTATTDLARGHIDRGLYCVGWLRRGASGTIPANRIDARMVADQIIHAVLTHQLPVAKVGYAQLSAPNPTLAKDFS